MLPLFIILMFPAASSSFVERMPISSTVPRKSSTEITSPTLYSFSNIINIPAMMSAISALAPRPTTRVSTPTEAMSAPVLTPAAFKTKKIIAIAQPYLTKPSSNARIVFARLLRFIIAAKISLTIRQTA